MIFGFCNPLLDISLAVTGGFLEEHRLNPNDAVLAGPEHAALQTLLAQTQTGGTAEGILSAAPVYSAGGSGQNSMRASQYLLKRQFAAKDALVGFFGCIGRDENGRLLEQIARERDGLKTHYDSSDAAPTGTCWCLLTPGHRSLVASLGAASLYSHQHFSSHHEYIGSAATIVYVTGFFCTVSPSTVRDLCRLKQARGFTLCANLSALFLIDLFQDVQLPLLQHSDYVFGNEAEVRHFCLKHGIAGDTASAGDMVQGMARFLSSSSCPTLVVTQGAQDTIVCSQGVSRTFPVHPVDAIVDTNGAGDCFVGGFLAALYLRLPTEECVRYGHLLASKIIQRVGIDFDDLF